MSKRIREVVEIALCFSLGSLRALSNSEEAPRSASSCISFYSYKPVYYLLEIFWATSCWLVALFNTLLMSLVSQILKNTLVFSWNIETKSLHCLLRIVIVIPDYMVYHERVLKEQSTFWDVQSGSPGDHRATKESKRIHWEVTNRVRYGQFKRFKHCIIQNLDTLDRHS